MSVDRCKFGSTINGKAAIRNCDSFGVSALADRTRKTENNSAAHAGSSVGRDQFQYFVELEI